MPSTMVPAQQLSDAGEDLVRLAAAKDAEIAALTEQRDRVMKLVELARAIERESSRNTNNYIAFRAALAALDAEAAAEREGT